MGSSVIQIKRGVFVSLLTVYFFGGAGIGLFIGLQMGLAK
jgi:hypothetical protein